MVDKDWTSVSQDIVQPLSRCRVSRWQIQILVFPVFDYRICLAVLTSLPSDDSLDLQPVVLRQKVSLERRSERVATCEKCHLFQFT